MTIIMGRRRRVKPRILCVNCHVCVRSLRKYPALDLEPVVNSVICTWVHPRIILEGDYICGKCRDLAIAAVNNSTTEVSDSQAKLKTKGHSSVCLLCGYSILYRRSDKLVRENPTEMQQSIFDLVKSKVEPREISASDCVCHSCWWKVNREVIRLKSHDERRPEPDTEADLQQDPNLTQPPARLPQPAPTESVRTQIIALPNYRRAPNTSSVCVVPNCTSTSLHTISDRLRAMVLHEHKYYLPKSARICDEHLQSTMWDTLFNSERSMNTFNVGQIEHVFSLVNAYRQSFDFECIEGMDDRLFEYLLGMTKANFKVLIDEIESTSKMRRAPVGLAAHLLKIRSGDTNRTIASLFQVPRSTLEGLMDLVSKILCKDSVEDMVVAEEEK